MIHHQKSEAPRCWAILPAAGAGRRMGERIAKQYLQLAGHPVIHWAMQPLLVEPRVSGLVVVLAQGDRNWPGYSPASSDKLFLTAQGGSERYQSVRNGLQALREHADNNDWVLVHDAVRPCLPAGDLDCLLGRLWEDEVGGLLAVPVRDTMKEEGVDTDACRVARTVPRVRMWLALTPQMFRYGLLCDALDQAIASGLEITDEAAAIEHAGYSPRLVEGHSANLKITFPQDLLLAEALLAQEAGA